jgi:predicted TIM-barrel fold metal-dependent hydrolase
MARELLEELREIPTIDAHEHLMPEEEHIRRPVDFYALFEHYCVGDLVAAGAGEQEMTEFADRSIPEAERWARFRPYFDQIRTGAYARAALWVVRDILGLPELSDATYAEVGRKLRDINAPGLYDRILRRRCNLVACIQCVGLEHLGPAYFFHLAPSAALIDVAGPADIERLSRILGRDVLALRDVLECMDRTVEEWRADPRVVGIKFAQAYGRSLEFRRTEEGDAEAALRRITADGRSASPSDIVVLQDFLAFALTDRAGRVDLPVVIHTGLQAGNYNRVTNANPLLLQELIAANPRTRFDLFHGGTPWVREIAVLAKYFPHVFLNMAWMHVISPTQARAALAEWLDMVPNSKIFGFGGDYSIVEKVYGHLKIARENIALVLSAKVREGAWSRADASMVARRLMHDNPVEFYRLDLE